jgi:hypothetical protein
MESSLWWARRQPTRASQVRGRGIQSSGATGTKSRQPVKVAADEQRCTPPQVEPRVPPNPRTPEENEPKQMEPRMR